MHAIRLRAWWCLLVARRTVAAFMKDSGLSWSAATAFYLILSAPPLLIAFTSIGVALVGEETARSLVTQQAAQFLPSGSSQVQSVAQSRVSLYSPASLISIAFLLVSGSRVFATLTTAVHEIWSHVEDAGWLRRQLDRFVLLAIAGSLFAASVALQLGAAVISKDAELPAAVGWALRSQVLPLLFLFLGLIATYRLLPRGSARWRTAVAGALVGTVLLRAAQYVFTLFLSTFGGFESTYGPLASVAIVMTWALIASVAILLAAELVAVLDRRRVPGRKRSDGEEAGPEAQAATA